MKKPSSLDPSSLELEYVDLVAVETTFLFLSANHSPMSTLFLVPGYLGSGRRVGSLRVDACVLK